MRIWLVIENTPGYLPETDPMPFWTRKEAESYARSLKEELRDLGYKVYGSAKRGYYYAQLHENDLGRVIEIVKCEDPKIIAQYLDLLEE